MNSSILSQIFSAGTFEQTIRSATPVALAALGGLMTEHAGIMNIGMDGMILMGALTAVLGSYFLGSAFGGIMTAVLFGILVGLFFALFVVKLKSDEFIIGCALNIFASGFTAYVSRAVFGLSGTSGYTIPCLSAIEIPLIRRIPFIGEIISGNTILVYATWLLVFIMWVVVYQTPYGFWTRAAGEKPETLRTAGISPDRMKWLASILCGMFCGLAGAYLSLGYLNGTFVEGMSASRGYIAFACVIFASANPGKAYLAALMFGFFDAIGLRLQNYISSDLTSAIPYAITIIMMVYVVVRKEQKKKNRPESVA
ncbi:MAG: ABC transporter permease [Clostridiales bacterium]|nr:ABC transporter permease [Clostridiales bacterium]